MIVNRHQRPPSVGAVAVAHRAVRRLRRRALRAFLLHGGDRRVSRCPCFVGADRAEESSRHGHRTLNMPRIRTIIPLPTQTVFSHACHIPLTPLVACTRLFPRSYPLYPSHSSLSPLIPASESSSTRRQLPLPSPSPSTHCIKV